MKNLQTYLNSKGATLKTDGVIGPQTLTVLDSYIKTEIRNRKYVMPVDGLVWLRTDQIFSNKYDDFVVCYKAGKIVYVAPASTTAGDFYIYNPFTVGGITGTAVAVPQQVTNSHRFVTSSNWKTLWLGAPYFMQILPITIHRDSNRDRNVDKMNKQVGLFGINFHKGGIGNWVNKHSAGCQTVPDKDWFEIIKRFNPGQVIDFTLID